MHHGPPPRSRTANTGQRCALILPGRPNWVFLTVCAEKRSPWLAQSAVRGALPQIWQKDQAAAWLVSDYVLMPDHLHLFCVPRDLKFTIERWMGFWKDRFCQGAARVWDVFKPAVFIIGCRTMIILLGSGNTRGRTRFGRVWCHKRQIGLSGAGCMKSTGKAVAAVPPKLPTDKSGRSSNSALPFRGRAVAAGRPTLSAGFDPPAVKSGRTPPGENQLAF